MKIKRKIRFIENTIIEQYTGLIFLSNKIIKNPNPNPNQVDLYPLKLNVTKFFLKNNNFCLINNYIPQNKIEEYISKNYNISKKSILNIDIISKKKGTKVIYLVYLEFNAQTDKLIDYNIINLYSIKNVMKYNDLYLSIYNSTKKIKQSEKIKKSDYTLYYNDCNTITIKLIDIFYYLIGNDKSNNELKEYINI